MCTGYYSLGSETYGSLSFFLAFNAVLLLMALVIAWLSRGSDRGAESYQNGRGYHGRVRWRKKDVEVMNVFAWKTLND